MDGVLTAMASLNERDWKLEGDRTEVSEECLQAREARGGSFTAGYHREHVDEWPAGVAVKESSL